LTQYFAWRVLLDGVATRQNISWRGVVLDEDNCLMWSLIFFYM